MTRKSRREIERAVEDLEPGSGDDDAIDPGDPLVVTKIDGEWFDAFESEPREPVEVDEDRALIVDFENTDT